MHSPFEDRFDQKIGNQSLHQNNPFISNEIRQSISKLKNKKSAGNDLIQNEFIKTSSGVLLPVLTKVFNTILNNGKVHQSWNLSVITSLYKS